MAAIGAFVGFLVAFFLSLYGLMPPGFTVEYFLIGGAVLFIGVKHLVVAVKERAKDKEEELLVRATTLSKMFTDSPQRDQLSQESHEMLYTSYHMWRNHLIDDKRFDEVLKGIEKEVSEVLLPRVKAPDQLGQTKEVYEVIRTPPIEKPD